MIFEDLEIIWRDEKSHPSHTIDDGALRRIVADRAGVYGRNVFWRDFSDIGVHVLTAAMLFGVCIWGGAREGKASLENLVPLLLIALGYTFAAGVRFFGRQKQKRREKEFDDSIRGNLQKLVANSEYQIRLQSQFLWWYVVPVVPGYLLLSGSFWSSGPEAFGFMTVTIVLIFWFILWGNKRSIQKSLVPQQKELESLLAGLENGGRTAEIHAVPGTEKRRPTKTAIATTVMFVCLAFGFTGWFLKICFWPAEGPVAPTFTSLAETEEIDAWLEETAERSNYPSLSVAIVRDGTIVYQGVVGFENTWTRRKATTNTAYHVASVSKAFTASLAVVLHDRGVINLDEPIAKYLPADVSISATPEQGAKITFRQLASHTSGLLRGVPADVQSAEWRYELEPQRLYDLLAEVALEYEPGTDSGYSNLGCGLLGHALALAAGKPLNDLLQEHLCQPLDLKRTAYHVDPDLPKATGYSTPPRLPERVSYKRRMAGSGGLVTTTADLAKFLIAHMQAGVFNTNMLREMHSPTKLKNGVDSFRALGWARDEGTPAGTILSKNGGRKNCSAWIGFAPEHGVGVAVITNIGEPDVDPIGKWLLARAIPSVDEIYFEMLAPFTAVRWETEADEPTVRVRGEWFRLSAIDGIPIDRLMKTARDEFGSIARKRFTEDLVELLHVAGHKPGRTVTLMLDRGDGKGPASFEEEMTNKKRETARDFEE